MAANKAQGGYLTVFLGGLTVALAGIANVATGLGKVLVVVGVVGILGSLFGFLGIKPLEGKPAQRPGAEGGKIAGALVALLGWAVTLVGLHFVNGTGGRIVLALVGIAVSLYGILYILPTAVNRNAIWKA